ncbi:hypothetical protein PGS_00003850 [Porphyromonas gingivalis A7A1-28]|nr:hypothetical protein PGS_00003850 [Porphyromonas gingivalis A7A1-28]
MGSRYASSFCRSLSGRLILPDFPLIVTCTENSRMLFFGAERRRIAEPKISKTRTTRKIFTREIFLLLARVLFFSRTIFFRSAIVLFHALQPLGKQFLLPVEKGFGSRGRGAYRLPYNIGMPHVILHRYNDQTDPHYTEQTEP